MNWKKLAPWNWFRDEQASPSSSQAPTRHEAFPKPFAELRMEIDRLFDETFRRSMAGTPEWSAPTGGIAPPLRPNVDISEGKKAYTVRAELPGVDMKDVSLELDGHVLVIHAEKRQEQEDEDEGYHWVERSYGVVQRMLSLPEDADVDAIEARFKNGVLKLRIPKQPTRESSGRPIEIEEG